MRAIVLLSLSLSAAAAEADPFAGVQASTAAPAAVSGFFTENFGFRRELMSQAAASRRERASSRQSAGFEVLKKFSSETATYGSVNLQLRLVRRDRFIPVQNDMEGMSRPGWRLEHHNVYADFYDLLGNGRVNARAGRFYVPFGLNLQTDTHGTILQLSNERNFGFERDWYAGLYGGGDTLNLDAYWLAGSGYDLRLAGQSGLAALRASLANRFLSEHGLEGGVSGLAGERLSADRLRVPTRRAGADARLRRAAAGGLATGTAEWSGGTDAYAPVFTQLYQAEYLRGSRRWGLAAQYRRFRMRGVPADASVIGEATWYFRNDVASSNLHWLKLNVERQVQTTRHDRDTIVALQYYRYW